MSDQKSKKAFVAGWPIKHSMSPILHGYWIDHFGLNATYERVAVKPGHLSDLVAKIRNGEFCGGNITIPHKEDVVSFADQKTELVDLLGAANTLWMEGDKLFITNTDAYGFAANLDELAPNWKSSTHALVLGAGGASRAVIFALLDAGIIKIDIANRNLDRAKELCERFSKMAVQKKCDLRALPQQNHATELHDLIINTTALGMVGQPQLDFDLSKVPHHTIVTDIVYNPLETELLRQAKARSLQSVDGLGMLLHQAVPGFEKWFGKRPQVSTELRQHVLSAMSLSSKDG